MLKNLTPDLEEIERRKLVALEHNFKYRPQIDSRYLIEDGIYESSFPFNFPEDEFFELQKLSYEDRYEIFDNYKKITYGVADDIEQIKNYYKEEIEDPDSYYVIAFTKVYQNLENKGRGGGWRWHKWGEYIGELNPQCEYLDDEEFGEFFKFIITWTLYKI